MLLIIQSGRVFGYASHLTWEFTSDSPIRSVFPLRIFYGLPLTLLKWICDGIGYHTISPATVYYTLRALMFVLSFVLEDWALDELIHVPKDRRVAQMLVASSYVTWTFQNHTFSNSIETLIVLWCLVLINRIKEDKACSAVSLFSESFTNLNIVAHACSTFCSARIPLCTRNF
jgi:phosphatidylinositol glycan class Z